MSLKVGDKVRLSDVGLLQIGGLTTKTMVEEYNNGFYITKMDIMGLEPETFYMVEVSAPCIGKFMLMDDDLEGCE